MEGLDDEALGPASGAHVHGGRRRRITSYVRARVHEAAVQGERVDDHQRNWELCAKILRYFVISEAIMVGIRSARPGESTTIAQDIQEMTCFRNRPEYQSSAESYWPSVQPRAAALGLLSHHWHECYGNYGPLSYATVRQLVDDHQTLHEQAVADRRHHSAAGSELIDQ